jgi:putative oxidoreductase
MSRDGQSDVRVDYAALVLRLTVGSVFLAHAHLKAVVLTLPGTAAFFIAEGFPGWTAYPVFVAELFGGSALLFGTYTRVVSLALVPVLLGALTVHWSNGWYFGAPNGGWEFIAVLLGALMTLTALGDGRFSLIHMSRGRTRTLEHFTPEYVQQSRPGASA